MVAEQNKIIHPLLNFFSSSEVAAEAMKKLTFTWAVTCDLLSSGTEAVTDCYSDLIIVHYKEKGKSVLRHFLDAGKKN